MRSSEEIDDDLLLALQSAGDEALAVFGFRRRSSSREYVRVFREARQAIVFAFDMYPRHQPGVELHIHPRMRLEMKAVSDEALALVGGNEMLLAGAPCVIVNQPIELAAAKEHHARWFATGLFEMKERVGEIVAFCAQWVIPLLQELGGPEDLSRICETDDHRVMKQRHWYLFAAASENLLGNRDRALSILTANLGSPGLRKRYHAAFEALARE